MTTFNLTMRIDNAAFDENEAGEVARILRETAAAIEANGPGAIEAGRRNAVGLRDANGNKVGYYEVLT